LLKRLGKFPEFLRFATVFVGYRLNGLYVFLQDFPFLVTDARILQPVLNHFGIDMLIFDQIFFLSGAQRVQKE